MGLLWEFFLLLLLFFCLPWECWDSMGIGTSVGTRVALLGVFLEVCFGPSVHGVMELCGLGGRGFQTDFRRYDKIIHWNWGRYSFLIPANGVWTRTLVCLHLEDSQNQYRVAVILGLGRAVPCQRGN